MNDWLRIEEVAGSSDLLIIFSHTNYPSGKFAMSRSLGCEKFSRVYVNCAKNGWYQQGVGLAGGNVDSLVNALRGVIEKLAPSRVFTTGMSMGGYAAILFGMLLGVTRVLAFTAELQIGERHSRSWTMNGVKHYDYRYKSLNSLLQDGMDTRVTLVIGGYDLIDMSLCWPGAAVLAGSDLIDFCVVGGAHLVTNRIGVPKLVSSVITDRGFNYRDGINNLWISPRPTVDEILLWREMDALKREKRNDDLFVLLSGVDLVDVRPNLCLELSNTCLNRKDFQAAERYASMGLKMDEFSHPLHHCMGLIHFSNGRFDEALFHFKAAVRLEPLSGSSYYRLALSAEKVGDSLEAVTAAKHALRLLPGSSDVSLLIARLEN